MKAPTRFFLGCLGLAALAVAGDYFYLRYLESHLTKAVAACKAESNRLFEASTKSQTQTEEKPNSADDYAAWIVKNKDKQGTEEFEIVARAYQIVKAEESRAEDGSWPKGQGRYVLEEAEDTPISGTQLPVGWRHDYIAGLVCEPFELSTAGYDLEKIRPVQREVVEAYKRKESLQTMSIGLLSAAMLVLVGILPLGWYFLLRRLREIGAAIRGE